MVESYNKHRSLSSISQWRTGLFSSEHWADVSYGWSKEMWLWEETWRESLTFSCIQKSFNASKDIQGWVDTVNLNLLTQNQYLSYLLVHRFDTTAKPNKHYKNKTEPTLLAALLLVLTFTEESVEICFVLLKLSKSHISCWILLKNSSSHI